MRFVTYNFLLGGSPTRDAWKAINRLEPDVLLGQECLNPPSDHLLRSGIWAQPVLRRWGTGIFVAGGAIHPIEVPGFAGWIAGGELPRTAWNTRRPLRVFSVHCPRGE